MTEEQEVVVRCRIKDWYELLGTVPSSLNGFERLLLSKGASYHSGEQSWV